MDLYIGFILVILAGLGTGTSAWPFKKIKDIHLEQYMLVYMFTALIFVPWIVVFFNIPDLLIIIQKVGFKTLFISNLFSISWGIANVLSMICIMKIGASLVGAILTALGMSVGILLPMIFKGSGLFSKAPDLFSNAGIVIIMGLFIIVIGLIFISIAGFGREKILNNNNNPGTTGVISKNFLAGLLLTILGGFLSCGISLAFVYSQGPIIEAVKLQGENEIVANFAVWALGMFGGGVINILYAIYLMSKNRSWGLLFARKDELLFGAIVGLQLIISIIFLGRGMILLGALGASVGFGIQQSLQVIGSQLVGFIGGEWKGIIGIPRKRMYLGLIIILFAVIVFAYSNTMLNS